MTDVLRPRALVLPRETDNHQKVSGAIWISGANLLYWPADGTNSVKTITAT